MIVSSSRWLRFWNYLTEPAPDVSISEKRRKARALAALLLFLMPLVLIDFVSTHILNRAYLPFAFALPLFLAAYFLSRTRYFWVGGLMTVLTLYLLPIVNMGLIADVVISDVFFIIKYPLLTVVATYFLFPRYLLIMLLLILATGIALDALIDDVSPLGLLVSADLFITSLAIVFVMIFLHRDELRERQRAEKLILQNEERYRILSNLVSDYVYAAEIGTDQSINTQWMAGAVEAITGYPPEEARKLDFANFIHPDDQPIFQNRWERLQQGLVDISEYRIITKTGEVRWLRDYGYGVTDPEKQRVSWHYGAAQDVTERRLKDEALLESEARFRAITESNVVAIVIARISDDVIVYCNERAAALVGTTTNKLIGMKVSQLAPDQDDFRSYMSMVAQKGFVANTERRLQRFDGEVRWVDASVQTMILNDEPTRLSALIDITERKVAEEALERSQTRYETLVNSIDGVVWEAETESPATTFISQQVEQLLGYPAARFYADPLLWSNCIHPDDRAIVHNTTQVALAKRQFFQHEYRMIAADGRTIWIHDIVTVVHEEGYPLRMRGLALNITASKEAQAAEMEQRRVTEALRDTTETISTTLDLNEVLDRILTQLSVIAPIRSVDIMLIENGVAGIVRSIGYGEYEAEITKARLHVETTPNLRRMVETGQPLIIHDTGEFPDWVDIEAARWIRSVISVPIRLEWQTIGFLNMVSQVPNQFTDEHAEHLQAFADQVAIAIRNARLYEQVRRYADELETLVQERTTELEVERRRIQVILDATGEGVFYTEGLRIRYANDALCRVTGFKHDEMNGLPGILLYREQVSSLERRRLHSVINHLRRDKLWRGEMRLRRKDGSLFDAGLTISLVGSPTDKPLRAVTIVRDISREKQLQAQRSRLVAHASHELRTPITNLKTRLYLLRRRPENLEYHLDILDEVSERMKKLVEDLLDVSRLERGTIPMNRSPLALQPLIERIVQIQEPEAWRKHQALTLEAPANALYVYADAERLTQVITNLLTNAINYTPEDGAISVIIEIGQDGKSVLIHIKDTGVGIALDNLPYIFQPFFRVMSEVDGTGLGLSIAKEIVDQHDGEIEVHSNLGEGSTFTVRLALLPQPALNA